MKPSTALETLMEELRIEFVESTADRIDSLDDLVRITRAGDGFELALQDLLRQGRGRTVHFHWVENGSAFAMPGQPLPNRTVIDASPEITTVRSGVSKR